MSSRTSSREWEILKSRKVRFPEGARVIQYLQCDCGKRFDVPRAKSDRTPQVIANMARRKGWSVNIKKHSVICPDCECKGKEPMPKTATIKPPSETPPRVMDKEDRRKIFRAIDEAYDGNGYCSPVTDQSIADELKVPWGWVAQIRDENFGPAGPDPELVAMMKKLEEFRLHLTKLEEKAMDAAAATESMSKEVIALSKRVREKLDG